MGFYELIILLALFGQALAKDTSQANELFVIQNQVHAFYQDAWSDLMIFISISLGMVGVVMPLIITYLQNKSFKLQKEEMKEAIEASKKEILADAKRAVAEDIKMEMLSVKTDLEETRKSMREEIANGTADSLKNAEKIAEEKVSGLLDKKMKELSKDIENAEGKIFHVQANLNSEQKNYVVAVESYLIAARCYCTAADITNFKTCLINIEDELKEISLKDFEEKLKGRFASLIKVIKRPETEEEFKGWLQKIAEMEPANKK